MVQKSGLFIANLPNGNKIIKPVEWNGWHVNRSSISVTLVEFLIKMINFGFENSICEFKVNAVNIKIKDQTKADFLVLKGRRL